MTDEFGKKPAASGSVELRTLAAPSQAELEKLAAVFDRYRAHYGEATDTTRVVSWLAENIGSGRLEAFIAEDHGEYIGFAMTTAVPASLRLGQFWQIRDLFVSPAHRRLGVGGALLDCIRAAAISAGASRVSLQTEADNTSALRLYTAKGYSKVEGYCSVSLALKPDSRAN